MRSEHAEDVFQSLILREVVLADGLQGDLQKAKLASWLGEAFAQPASLAIDSLVRSSTTLALPKGLTKKVIIEFFQEHHALYGIRAGRGVWSRLFHGRDHTAHSYCRSALCYAVYGNYPEAESWLQRAEGRVGDLARPNFIRGLMYGAQGEFTKSEAKLKEALSGRSKKETKERISDAITFAEQCKAQCSDAVD